MIRSKQVLTFDFRRKTLLCDPIRLGQPDCQRARALPALLARFGIGLIFVADPEAIPGSYWGEPEAGLVGTFLYVRADTPIHSVLHEACHVICMEESRRASLRTDAGGDDLEECAVCYLSILLADQVLSYDRKTMFRDMDSWGYSFRLGSARTWFETDSEDAVGWLRRRGIIDAGDNVLRNLSRPHPVAPPQNSLR